MTIPLNMGSKSATGKAAQLKALEHDVLAAKDGDWEAKNRLFRTFTQVITKRAEKRASDTATINKFIEAGKNGLFRAAKKYKPAMGPEKFQIAAVDYIDKAMDDCSSDSGGGFFAKLFKK